ncbi:hypothetical protein ZWY2020_031167 [Hordeum vulgare]|nr:hypothetical protein ZWY2020_031167 [Hordeum vulgare]
MAPAAAGGASLLAAVAVFSMLIMSSQGNPRPLCSDCEPQCRTNCTAEVETTCREYCTRGGGPRESCRSSIFERCTANGDCSGSNGTSTCDCNTMAENTCLSVTDGTLQCRPCMSNIYDQCFHPCTNDCNNRCKKKGCHNA